MSSTCLKTTCFTAHIKLAYYFHIMIFSLCALVGADKTAAVKFSLSYVTVAPRFFGTGNSVLPD